MLPVYGHVRKTNDVEFCLNLLLALLNNFELKDDELSLDLKREGKEIGLKNIININPIPIN